MLVVKLFEGAEGARLGGGGRVVLEWRLGILNTPFGVIKADWFHSHLNRWAVILIFHRVAKEGLLQGEEYLDMKWKMAGGILFLLS